LHKKNKTMSEQLSPKNLKNLIRSRRSIYPPMYIDEAIDEEIIKEMLENANWAPNHKKTEPWRFKIYRSAARQKLADWLSSTYKERMPVDKFSEKKFQKLSTNPVKSDTVIAIIMQRDPDEQLPEWEELAAVAMAVQNLWLTATAYGLGAYWASPGLLAHAGDFMNLKSGERCYGLFYLAHHNAPEFPGIRKDIEEKVEWILE